MLVAMKKILTKPKKGAPVATPAYDEYPYEWPASAEEENAPVILDFAELMVYIHFWRDGCGMPKSPVPVAINLDHGCSFEIAIKRSGWLYISYDDRSTLPLMRIQTGKRDNQDRSWRISRGG